MSSSQQGWARAVRRQPHLHGYWPPVHSRETRSQRTRSRRTTAGGSTSTDGSGDFLDLLTRGRSAYLYLVLVVIDGVLLALSYISDLNASEGFNIIFTYIFTACCFVILGLTLVAIAFVARLATAVAFIAVVAVAVAFIAFVAVTVTVEILGKKRSAIVLLLLVIILASGASRNRELGERCSSDADCMSGLSCYNWNGFTGKKCVWTTIANPFSAVVSRHQLLQLGERCSSDADCMSGLSCYNWNWFTGKKCVRTTIANPFNTVNTSLPFNTYAFLTTHNSFSITGVACFTLYNQEDSVTDQLNNGVRALMLDVYDYRDDIWLCHSLGGKCFYLTALEPAIYTMWEIEAFLLTNPSEIVTLILEDHVTSHHGLSKLFNKTGLMKYWFPVSRMPRDGEDWPRVTDMIKLNHRLLVFTSNRLKESSEEIAYQWNYMVENQYGDGGMDSDVCYNRLESPVLSDRTKSLVLVNYFRTIPLQWTACMEHSRGLVDVLNTCYAAAGNRWANFLAVDYYKRSDGGGVFQAIDMLNGMLICGRNDVRACRNEL